MTRILVTALLLSALPLGLWAQKPSDSESRHMNMLILNTLDEYIRTSSLSDNQDVFAFIRLFENGEDECVYNDLMGTPGYQDLVSPTAYTKLVNLENGSLLRTEISRIRKDGGFYQEGELWHRRIILNKYIMLIDASVYTGKSGGVLFDSDKLYPDHSDFTLVLDMVYHPDEDVVRIAGIQAQQRRPSNPVDKSFAVLMRPDTDYADYLYVGDSKVVFNDFDQAIVDMDQLAVNDNDVVLKFNKLASSSQYDVLMPVFKKYHIRLKPRFSTTISGAFHFTTEPENVDFNASSGATEAGLDIGISLGKFSRSSRMILYAGAAMSWSKVEMSAGSFNYRYGSAVPLSYEISSVLEGYSYRDFVFPLYLEYENSLGTWGALSIDLGAKAYLSQSATVSTPFHFEGSFSRAGDAPVSISQDFDRFIAAASYGKTPYDFSVFGQIGLDVRLVSSLYAFIAGGYEYGVVVPAFTSSNMPFYRAAVGNLPSILPVVYAGGRQLAYHSFVDCVSFNRQAIWLSAGLKIKL